MRIIILIAVLACTQLYLASCASWLPAEREQALEQQLAHSSTVHSVRAVFWGDFKTVADTTVRPFPTESRYSREAWDRLR